MRHLPLVTFIALLAAPAAAQVRPPGYLADKPAIDMMNMLPPPPAPGSAEERAERQLYRDSRRVIGGPLWNRAISQLSVTSPAFVQQLSCAVGVQISPQTTPATYAVLARAGADLAPAINRAKQFHERPRPFTTDGGKACDPDAAVDGGKELGFAYPSGHAAVGWLWGLLLADLRPARSAAILKFGKETGDLRLACRVHWLSDVTHGRLFATAIYQRITSREDFQADAEKARLELTLAPVPEGCPAE